MKQKVLISIFLLAFAYQSLADLPVHCLKHHAVGTWEFAITNPMHVDDPYKMSCGHEIPDSAANSYLSMSDSFKPFKTYNVQLSRDNVASESSLGSGTWTMIYDEAMDVTISHHKFTAFFSYFPKESGQVMSYCGKTVVGWYLDTQTGRKGCFRAEKHVSEGEKQSLYVEPLTQMFVVQPEDTVSLLQINPKDSKFLNTQTKSTHKMHKAFNDHDSVVHHLNNKVEKSWTAKSHDMYKGKTVEELNRLAGRKKMSSSGFERHSLKNEFMEKSNVNDLPKNFDWKSKLPSPKQQLDCGSCYVFATLAMLESRIKIKYNKNVLLSPQHVLDCSFHNQGCDGGYPFLVEKFAHEFELVEESCAPYTGRKGSCGACNTQSLSQVYKVSDYRFVGGAYGKSNERNMMQELMQNGPMVVSFEPTYDFMYYSGGVFHSVDADWVKSGNERPEWERVDHSVILYGWGETSEGEKYWMLMNSWGTDWGENGHFRMKRGVDESAIESLAEAADPVIVQKH